MITNKKLSHWKFNVANKNSVLFIIGFKSKMETSLNGCTPFRKPRGRSGLTLRYPTVTFASAGFQNYSSSSTTAGNVEWPFAGIARNTFASCRISLITSLLEFAEIVSKTSIWKRWRNQESFPKVSIVFKTASRDHSPTKCTTDPKVAFRTRVWWAVCHTPRRVVWAPLTPGIALQKLRKNQILNHLRIS